MITYKFNPTLTLEELIDLYDSVEWSGYTNRPEMLEKSYQNSLLKIAAYDSDQLIGLIRVVGDGYSIIFIQDILVRPDYQRRKIGSQLMKQVLDKYPDYYQIQLLTDNSPKTTHFYESLGFQQVDQLGAISFTYRG